MTIDEALKETKYYKRHCRRDFLVIDPDVINLCIEALKRCKANRNPHSADYGALLPGETGPGEGG